jgi:uncharacterized protein involved in exopolysaccharide biosynthesis
MGAALGVSLAALAPGILWPQRVYTATVKLLVTAPEATNVDIYNTYRVATPQDEITLATNNFVDILNSDQTRQRTIEALNLPAQFQDYALSVQVPRDTAFLRVSVKLSNDDWATKIANMHVTQAQQYFGEIRAQPTTAIKTTLGMHLQDARTELRSAQTSVIDFQQANQITALDSELSQDNNTLGDLYRRRNQAVVDGSGAGLVAGIQQLTTVLEGQRQTALAEGDKSRIAALDDLIAFQHNQISSLAADSPQAEGAQLAQMIQTLQAQRTAAGLRSDVIRVNVLNFAIAYHTQQLISLEQQTLILPVIDQLISQQRAKILALEELQPQYDELKSSLSLAQANYDRLLGAYQEAVVKEDTALRADFIQVALPAAPDYSQVGPRIRDLVPLGVAASLAVAIALAYAAEGISRLLAARKAMQAANT